MAYLGGALPSRGERGDLVEVYRFYEVARVPRVCSWSEP